jgi:hypothetical protein
MRQTTTPPVASTLETLNLTNTCTTALLGLPAAYIGAG